MVDSKQEEVAAPHIIIPMAGYGKRFKEQGFQMDKPLIPVGNRHMLDWVLDTIPKAWRRQIVAVTREEQTGLRDILWDWQWDGRDSLGPEIKSVVLAGPTQGAACTVLAAAVGLPPDEPVIVMNADQWFRLGERELPFITIGPALEWDKSPSETLYKSVFDMKSLHQYALFFGWDGFILTFPGTGPQWSYAVLNGDNRVVHVIEKKEVSKHATCGVYWWRRAGDLVHSICAMIASGQRTNNEFYLAPALNFLPLSDKLVRVVPVEEFHGLGTPEQVKEFEALLATEWKSE